MISAMLERLRRLDKYDWIALTTIILVAVFPLFFSFPYRVNIFLSWEGAYRMYLGQKPFVDFGLPMGYIYWLIPALFFKLFGPFMASLIKAQVLINVLSGLAFFSILGSFKVKSSLRALSVFVFCISYSLFNFWPWYNHSVIVFQFIAYAFLIEGILSKKKSSQILLILAAFFTFLSFFTKQDGGGMALIIGLGLLLVNFLYEKDWKKPAIFLISYGLFTALFIVPLLDDGFGYWFNYGQAPHNSRLALKDFIDIILGGSQWEKFYLFLVLLIVAGKLNGYKNHIQDQLQVLFAAFTILILGESLLLQVTSYTPPNNNIFFHSFGFVFIFSQLSLGIDFSKKGVFAGTLILVLFWWSGSYWKYIDRIIKRAAPSYAQVDEEKISVKTFMKHQSKDDIAMDKWVFSSLQVFKNVYMPKSTVEGIDRLLEMPLVKNIKGIKVLNMSELTPLAQAMPYKLETGMPLWYHVGVGIFDEQVDMFCERIEQGYYDLVLFEEVPYLNNFFPAKIQLKLKAHYQQVDRFLAPRRPTDSYIYVYVKGDTELFKKDK